MPSKSKRQKALMQAAAHNPAFAAKVGVPVKVARDFYRKDRRMADGGQASSGVRRLEESDMTSDAQAAAIARYVQRRKAKRDAERVKREELEPFTSVGPSHPEAQRYKHGGRVGKKKLYPKY